MQIVSWSGWKNSTNCDHGASESCFHRNHKTSGYLTTVWGAPVKGFSFLWSFSGELFVHYETESREQAIMKTNLDKGDQE